MSLSHILENDWRLTEINWSSFTAENTNSNCDQQETRERQGGAEYWKVHSSTFHHSEYSFSQCEQETSVTERMWHILTVNTRFLTRNTCTWTLISANPETTVIISHCMLRRMNKNTGYFTMHWESLISLWLMHTHFIKPRWSIKSWPFGLITSISIQSWKNILYFTPLKWELTVGKKRCSSQDDANGCERHRKIPHYIVLWQGGHGGTAKVYTKLLRRENETGWSLFWKCQTRVISPRYHWFTVHDLVLGQIFRFSETVSAYV